MTKILNLKPVIRFVLMLVLLAPVPVIAQTSQSESFDGPFPPAGWTLVNNPSLWVQRTTGTFPTCMPHSGNAMARFTARNQFPGTQDVFISPVIDYSGSSGSTPTVSIWVFRDSSSTAGDSLTIMINTAPSEVGAVRIGAVARSRYFLLPTNELMNGWYQYTFNVPASFNTADNYIVLLGTSQDGANIYVDDIEWDEYPMPCSGAPTAGLITADRTVICNGPGDANLTLTGGSSGVGGLIYQWQVGPTNTGPWSDVGTNDYTYNTGTLTASAYYRCYVTCSPSAMADTTTVLFINVTGTPAPVVVITPGTNLFYCTNSAPLLLVATGATSYTWTPNIAIPNGVGDTAFASPIVNTNYTIIGSDTVGCSGSININVQVRISPVVNAATQSDTICLGQSTQLQAQLTGGGFGTQILWQPGGFGGLNPTVSPTASTTYVVTATSQQTTCSASDSVTVEVVPAVVADFTYIVTNPTVTFTNASSNATSYFWNFGNGVTSTLPDPVYTYPNENTYLVTLIVSNGGCTDTIVQTVVVGFVGLPQVQDQEMLIVHPNPFRSGFTLQFNDENSVTEMKLINGLGQVVMNRQLMPGTDGVVLEYIETENLPSGIYTILINSNTGSNSRLIVKN